VPVVLRCHPGIGPAVSGTALVAPDNFSARYDLDRSRGIFSRPSHKLAGESYVDRILVLDGAKGGVATAWMLHDMAARGIVPRALIFNRVNPIIAQGAAFGGVALVDRFPSDVTLLFRTGDELRVDPVAGTVEILNRDRVRSLVDGKLLAKRRYRGQKGRIIGGNRQPDQALAKPIP
jgi:uncharacterized protein